MTRIYNTPDFISLSTGHHIGSVTIDIGPDHGRWCWALALMIGLQQLVNRTTLGKPMRAVAADREAAEMLGINVNLHDRADVLPRLGAGRCRRGHGRAAVQPGHEHDRLHRRPEGVHRGGGRRDRQSIPGAMLGGLLIGLAESFVTGYISSTYTNLIVFGILIAVMLVRPSGPARPGAAAEGVRRP